MSATRQRVVDLHNAGYGEAQIAAEVRLARDTVRRVLIEAGIARPAHLTRASARGENLSDPSRADKLLRRF